MGLIEQAARRLEELRQAGIEVPEAARAAPAAANSPEAPSSPVVAPPATAAATRPGARPESLRMDLDLRRLAELGFVTPDTPRTRLSEEFRILKRPLLANAAGKGAVAVKNGNLVMVTSAMPSEGKTFSSVNLAMSIAMELDQTVLLVDADVARPSLPRALGLPEGMPGLLDVLEGKVRDLSEVLIRTNVDKLTFLPSGKERPHASEMLASGSMSTLLQDLASRYPERMIIFDSPPLMVTTEARVLASRMGQIVFVVHAEKTLQSQVKLALATIESCPVKMIVLNAARTPAQGAYGYGYGYGYGS